MLVCGLDQSGSAIFQYYALYLFLQIVWDFRSITDTPNTECGADNPDNPDITIENVVFDSHQDPVPIVRPFFVTTH